MALQQSNQIVTSSPVMMGHILYSAFTFGAVSSTVVVANAPAGLYRFSCYAVVTTAQGSQTLTVNAIWTDDFGANTVAVLSAVSTTAQGYFQGSTLMENTATANLSYSIAATATTAIGNIYIVVERIY